MDEEINFETSARGKKMDMMFLNVNDLGIILNFYLGNFGAFLSSLRENGSLFLGLTMATPTCDNMTT